ncbi:MAG: hypothetical protein SGJ02_09895 [bacterium]|nr:hypothetical protein [bacterium]
MNTEDIYKEEKKEFINSRIDKFNLLLITATKIEKDALHLALRPLVGQKKLIKIQDGKQTYYLGIFGKYNTVHVSCGKMGSSGKQSSLTTTNDAITFCKPKVAIMIGIAFGKGGKQNIGDVLVSESITPYEVQRVGKKTISRGTSEPACSIIVDRFKHITDWKHEFSFYNKTRTPRIITGELLSGEKLVDHNGFKEKLFKSFPQAIGGEMEGVGLYAACDSKVKHWAVVKAICDWADGKKGVGKDKKQLIAAESAVALCLHAFNSSHAFADTGLKPLKSKAKKDTKKKVVKPSTKIPTAKEIEKEIIAEMKENTTVKLPSSINEVVRVFRSLDDQQKIKIAKKIGVYVAALNSMYAHERDKEIFSRAQKNNVLSSLWEELNKLIPFENATNPFTNLNYK